MARLGRGLAAHLAWLSIRAVCRIAVCRIDLQVEGLEHLPQRGPVLIAARHFHHFWDGCAILAVVPRPVRLVVTLDWLQSPRAGRVMAGACRAAGWPVVPRSDPREPPRRRAAGAARERRQLLAATRESVGWLQAGGALLVFPEGFPNVDPHGTPKTDDDAFLPFQPGFLRFVALAERDRTCRVPIVPAGLEYHRGRRWRAIVRFGAPLDVSPATMPDEQVQAIAGEVRRLSGLP